MIDIRPLTASDRLAWSRLLARAFDRRPEQMMGLLTHLLRSDLVAWGAWDGEALAAQYSCLLADLSVPFIPEQARVGISINMAVDPDYRGRGLVKRVSQPVYDQLKHDGVLAGVGFSNAEGVKVDRRSKGYGYQVVGQLVPLFARTRRDSTAVPIELTDKLPESEVFGPRTTHFSFLTTHDVLTKRYIDHPFRQYRFGVWVDEGAICGIVAYRPMQMCGVQGVSLLGAYGCDLPTLLRGFLNQLAFSGVSFVHCLTSPRAPLRSALQRLTLAITPPYKRSPFYLTAKPLQCDIPPCFLDFGYWNCLGGDVR